MSTSARDRWFPLVAELERSAQPLPDFARVHRVNPGTLKWWRTAFRREARRTRPAAPFTELTVTDPPPPRSAGVVLAVPRFGVEVQVTATSDLALLRGILEALC